MIETMISPAQVVTIEPEAGVLQAKAKMTSHDIRHLPVVDETQRLVGILSDRDLRSVMPYGFGQESDSDQIRRKLSDITVSQVMTPDPHTIRESSTLQDALVQFVRFNVGAFPVIDDRRRVVAMISYRDLLRMFIHFLGVEQPGSFLAVTATESPLMVQTLVDRISQENIRIASMLVIRPWEGNRSAVYLYLLTKNIAKVRKMVAEMGEYALLNPLQWFLRQFAPDRFPSKTAK
jgi:acetoin utilization protein AcuB